MRVIAVVNQKGGVGKTTTAVSLGAYLGATLAGQVLVLDLDPQANATSWLLGAGARPAPSTYELLLGLARLADIVVTTKEPGLFLAPANQALAGAQVELVQAPDRDLRLRAALEEGADPYTLVLIDCPPSLGVLTINALAAADAVLVPVQCEYLALEGLGQLLEIVSLVREELNPRLELLGMLLTMHDNRTNLSAQVVAEVRRYFPEQTFQHVVPRSVRLSEAPSYGQSILVYDRASRGGQAYAGVAEELVQRGYGA